MAAKKVLFGNDATTKMVRGINILADAVHLTVQQLRVFCGFQVR